MGGEPLAIREEEAQITTIILAQRRNHNHEKSTTGVVSLRDFYDVKEDVKEIDDDDVANHLREVRIRAGKRRIRGPGGNWDSKGVHRFEFFTAQELGEFMQHCRRAAGLSVRATCILLKTTRPIYISYEAGNRMPSDPFAFLYEFREAIKTVIRERRQRSKEP